MKSFFPYADNHRQIKERRLFIANLLKASLAPAFIFSVSQANANVFSGTKKLYTVGDVMDIVTKDIPGAPFSKTVDTLKSGSREMLVTGIVTTMFATVDIIREAIKNKANFIIAHEPTFYNHNDDPKWVTPNHIVKEKQDLLEKNKITVWRLHDYLHSFVPDSVVYEVVKTAGWLPYYKAGKPVLTIPAISLKDLAEHLKKKLNIAHLRVVGNLEQKCESIVLMPGAAGGEMQVAMVETVKPDVLIVGELREWETAEYIRDTQQLGEKTSLIVLGHSVSEEPGLQWLQEWLQPKLPEIKVKHIASGSPFTWV